MTSSSQEAHDSSVLPNLVRLQFVELDHNPAKTHTKKSAVT